MRLEADGLPTWTIDDPTAKALRARMLRLTGCEARAIAATTARMAKEAEAEKDWPKAARLYSEMMVHANLYRRVGYAPLAHYDAKTFEMDCKARREARR